jgi:hypothetical protein
MYGNALHARLSHDETEVPFFFFLVETEVPFKLVPVHKSSKARSMTFQTA